MHQFTDLPIIISGEWLCFMDPQKKIWQGEPGHKYKLMYYNNKPENSDSFVPFIFNNSCSLNSDKLYSGTLIRLPLRNEPSDISQKIYPMDKLKMILKALRADAEILLLFLRYVEKVEVFTIDVNNSVGKIFSIEADQNTKITRRDLKERFLSNVKNYHSHIDVLPLSLEYEVTMIMVDAEYDTQQDYKWIVINWVSFAEQKVVNVSKKVNSLPWLGLAIPFTQQLSSRLFCFLPMPNSKGVNPPLPVCVHGTFGLTNDRRQLKWLAPDMQNDDGALWNSILLSEMLPYCYAHCLSILKAKFDPDKFYSYWPDISIVAGTNWEIFLRPLLSLLLQDQLFWSQNGSWVKLQSSVYVVPQMNCGQFPQAVISALIKCDKVVVALDDRVWQAVQFVYPGAYPFTTITPSLVRQALKGKPTSYISLSRAEKLQLLHYCLEDKNYHDLPGLALLPVVDGTFVAFNNNVSLNKVYICDTSFLQTRLLANNEAVLVNLEKEDSNLHQKLMQVAKSSYTQLKVFKVEDFAIMLKQLLPFQNGRCSFGSAGGFYNENWLKTFWNWVNMYSLSYFTGIPLIPVCNEKDSNGFKIVALKDKSNSRVIKYNKSINYHPELISATGKLGCYLTCSDEFQFLYHSELNSYVHDLTPSSVLNISSQTTYQNVVFTQEEAKALRNFLFQNHFTLNPNQQSVVLYLSIFPAVQSNLHSLQSARCRVAGKFTALLISEAECLDKYLCCIPQTPLILTCENGYVQNLQSMLLGHSWLVTKTQVILYVILPAIQSDKFLIFFSVVLEPREYHSIVNGPEGSRFSDKLRSIKFIPTSQNSVLCLPSETYDPKDLTIKGLFEGLNVFPIAPFSEAHLAALRNLGMKNSIALRPPDIIKIAQIICHQSDVQQEIRRASKLLEFLSSYPGSELLNTNHNGIPLHQSLCSISWLPVMVDPPEDYPKCLGWKGATGNYFVSAQHLHASSLPEVYRNLPYLIGSQLKIPHYERSLSAEILASLHIPTGVPVDAMIQQILSLISHQCEVQRSYFDNHIKLLYEHLQIAVINRYSSKYWDDMRQSEVIQVTENKFVKPSLVACSFDERSITVGTLEPYLYILPSHLQQYRKLFCHIGAVEKANTSDVLSIIEDLSTKPNIDSNGNCLQLVIKVLKWLCNHFTEQEIQGLLHKIFVPISSSTNGSLVLKPANRVAFLDKDLQWLSSNEELFSGINKEYFLVHTSVSYDIAHSLQLKPLSTVIANTEEFGIEQAGQFEPLTTRLNRILKEYKDFSVMQELLQNADDAEATEVVVYYDTREHDNTNLLFPGMAYTYGPALLFYNNTEFTEEDFKNIRKIAGETKLNEPSKIGKYGIGFCSVYHITDVPSFVSGERFVIFDPTLQYLHAEIESKCNPGIMIKFNKHPLLNKSNQLNPYMRLCGFDPKRRFHGTLFRFPLRTKISEISEEVLTTEKVERMIYRFKQDSSKLLLFLNYVRKISFYVVNDVGCAKYFEVTAEKELIIKEESLSNSISLMTFTASNLQSNECSKEKWLVATNSQQLQTENKEKYGIASVSIKFKTDSQSSRLSIDSLTGECFCFLPLHMETGLPVHISSNFAVMSNRRGIWKADNDNSATKESNWNRMLMKTVVFQAYITLLLYLKELQQNEALVNYSFFSLWPLETKENNPWELLILQFYNSLLSNEHSLFYSSVTKTWNKLNQSNFLSHNILSISFGEFLYQSMLKVISILNISLVTISNEIWNKLDISYHFKNRVIKEEDFIKLFYQDDVLVKIPVNIKNIIVTACLIVFANNKHNEALPELMKATNCIPCCPNGEVFKKPQDVLNPDSKISQLFLPNDHMCPDETFYRQNDILCQALLKLEMKISLPWKLVVDRAKHVQIRFTECCNEYYDYLAILIECIKENLKNNNPSFAIKNELQKVPFLPVMQRPNYYPIGWKGDLYTFLCGSNLKKQIERPNSANAMYACGSQVFILDAQVMPVGIEKVINFLGITRDLDEIDVANQFDLLLQTFHNDYVIQSSDNLLKTTGYIVKQVYRYWENKEDTIYESVSCIKGKACIWHDKLRTFLHPSQVSFEWKTDGPFLYHLPNMIPVSLKPLMEYFGVKNNFPVDVLVNALYKMKQQYKDDTLPLDCQTVVRLILPELCNITSCDMKIFLPDENFVLRDAETLKYNDAPWSDFNKGFIYCHACIERDTAIHLGAMPVKSFMLEDLEITDEMGEDFEEFGQEEKLTLRLNNILRDYPRDMTFLKELLQNADDAGATKLYIILDKRYHGSETVISERWKELQGPALLFWNNSTFSKEDLKGIQRLGLGSKRDDADKIGQYGIGFNVVYHYTDCPSFITDNKLCILDPHYRYVMQNKRKKPGGMYKNLNELWNRFPDMRSIYLQKEWNKFPIVGGSLFRLPLKLTEEQASLSEIVQDVIHLQQLEEELKSWVSKVTEALLFLQNVSEIKLFVIDNGIKLQVHTSCTRGHQRIIKASENIRLVMFPIKLVVKSTAFLIEESKTDWLVQLGEGNVAEPEFDWKRIKPVNLEYHPCHGVAALLNADHLKGKSFSFLPLPGETNLPVHIHGQFILHSDRRSIWIYSDSSKNGSNVASNDPKANWNLHLCRAIGVAYAYFLIYLNHEESPSTKDALLNSLNAYYNLFPNLTLCNMEPWVTIARYVYSFLSLINAPILATLFKYNVHGNVFNLDDRFVIKWYNLHRPDTPDEPHFCSISDLNPDTVDVLKLIGMNITDTPVRICEQFNIVTQQLVPPGKQLPFITVESVTKYYTNFYSLIFNENHLPCDIAVTKFKEMQFFITFVKFLMKEECCFPEKIETANNFFSLGFIVTADENLHSLSDGKKIISSDNWRLFPISGSCFVHHDLRGIYNTHSKYLMENTYDQNRLDHLSSVINVNFRLSWDGKSTQVSYTDQDTDWIQNMLYCIANDVVFSLYCDQLMEKFPLLPADNDMSYSTASDILPLRNVIINNDPKPEYSIPDAKRLMGKLDVPLLRHDLSSSILSKIKIQLPSLLSAENVLRTLYLVKKHTLFNAYEMLSHDDFIVLFKILKMVSFSSASNTQYIKELPIFTTIANKLVNLASASEVWIWNDEDVCTTGVDQWISRVSNDIIFLTPSASWSCLKHEAENLGMRNINKYDVYCNFIFPNFHHLDSNVQLNHLMFIKNEIYLKCKDKLETSDKSNIRNFVTALKSLKCIPDLAGTLRTIESFYDHNEKIFQIFCNKYCFLPDKFRDSKWHSFLQHFGLRTIPTNEEFVSFCRNLHSFDISAIAAGSKLLLSIIFDVSDAGVDKYKHLHSLHCLQEISQIPIAIVKKMPELDGIKKQKMGEIMPNLSISLTKPRGSSQVENAHLVWTILPLIEIAHNGDASHERFHERCKYLGVVQSPNMEDVISNLRNLSTSIFAEFGRFERSSVASGSSLLPTIVVKMMEHLQSACALHDNVCNHLNQVLSNLNFFPVKLPMKSTEEYALVKPIQVICMEPSQVTPYYPFLHPLIDEANSVIKLLSKIGVKRSFHLHHIQFVLQSIKDLCKDNEVDLNNKRIVLKAVRELIRLLQQMENKSDAICQLRPLYLLSQENELTECSKLIVHDISHHFPPPTGYAYLNLFKDAEQQSIKELPSLLPKELGLKNLRSITTYELINSKLADNVYSNVSVIKEIIMSDEFKHAIEVFSSCCNQGKISPCVTNILTKFQSNLTVQVLINVQAKPKILISDEIFAIDDPKEHSFFLQKSINQKWILSLKNTQDRYRSSVFTKFANQLCSKLQLKSTKCFEATDNEEMPALTEFVCHILQCNSVSKIAEITKEYLPGAHNIETDTFTNINPALGDSMPERFHYMLDQSMFNFFSPEEWVGYEDEHGKIVCAQILCQVVCENAITQGTNLQQMMERRYIISVGLNETNIEVSALQLYKFMHNKAFENSPAGTEMDVYDGPSTSERTEQFSNVKIKKSMDKETIREAVEAAWALSEEQRKKALKRLYLLYHPDKNPDNPYATAEFQFLQQEIERMEKGISKDEADGKTSGATPGYSQWHGWYKQWDRTASSHRYSRSRHSGFSTGGGMPSSWNIPRPQPDLTESERWIGQAKYDYSALCVLADASRYNNCVSAATCFMCHEVAERSLKAGLYAKCGMGEVSLTNHNLTLPASALIQVGCPINIKDAEFLEQFYLDTRFPNRHTPPTIPGEKFSSEIAKQGFDAATRIYETMKQLIYGYK